MRHIKFILIENVLREYEDDKITAKQFIAKILEICL